MKQLVGKYNLWIKNYNYTVLIFIAYALVFVEYFCFVWVLKKKIDIYSAITLCVILLLLFHIILVLVILLFDIDDIRKCEKIN